MVERVGRKGTTTETGAQATRLNDPNLSAASFSREGVVDKSGLFAGEATARGLEGIAGGIRDFGNVALQVDEGIAKARLESDLLDEIEAADESRDPMFSQIQEQRGADAAIDFTAKQESANILRNEIGEGAAIAATDPDFANITRRLQNAKRTGVISIDEFELRTTEALRRAVARRPGLARELSDHASLVLGLNGARERLALQDKLLASQGQEEEARRNRAIKQLDKANAVFDFNASTDELEHILNNRRRQDQAYEQGKRIREIKETVTQEEGLSALRDQGSNFGAGAYTNASQTIMSFFAPDMSSSQLSQAKIQANNVVTQFRDEFDALGRNLQITNTPEFKDLKSNWIGAMENLSKSLEEAGSGDEAARIARNHGAVIQNQWNRQVYDSGVNPELARVANHMSPFVEATGLLNRQPHLQTPMAQIYESLLLQMTNNPSLDASLRSRADGSKSDLSLILGSAAKSSLPTDINNPGNKIPTDFEKMVDTAVETIERNIGKNQSLAFKTMTDTIRELSNPAIRDNLVNATPETKSQLIEMGIRQASALEPDRNRFLANASQQGVSIRNRVLPAGTLQFFTEGNTDKDRKLLREFNNKFTKKYNDLIRYNSVMFGMSVPQTSDLMAEIYGGGSADEIRQVIDSRRQKLNTEVPQDLPKDEGFVNKVIQIESGGNPNAEAKTSSALGVGQFTEGTWLSTIRKHEPELLEGKSRQEVLELRRDPDVSKRMISNLALDNQTTLEDNGVEINAPNLYLAHFLGANGASNLLNSSPNTPVEDILGNSQIRANKSVLEGKTVQEVIDWATRKIEGA